MDIERLKGAIEELQEMRKEFTDNPYITVERRYYYFDKYTEAIEALFDLWFYATDQPETEAKE